MKNLFETLHLRPKQKPPSNAAAQGASAEDWEGTQVTLSGWKSLVNGDPRLGQSGQEDGEQVFEGFGAGVGTNVDLAGLPTRNSDDMDFLLDDLDINSTPSSPAISYGGTQKDYYADGGETEPGHGFLGATEQDYRLQDHSGARQGENQDDKNRALEELFGAQDNTQDGLENLLSSFSQQVSGEESRGSAQAGPYEGAFFEVDQAKQEDFLDQLLAEAKNANPTTEAVPVPTFSTSSGLQGSGVFGSLNVFDSRNTPDFAKYQDSLPRISTLSHGPPPDLPFQQRVSAIPPQNDSNSPDDLCLKIASALAQKGVKPDGLRLGLTPPLLKPKVQPGIPTDTPGGVARSAPTSPPETPRFRQGLSPSQLRRTKSVHTTPDGSPRALSPAPGGRHFSPSPSPSTVLTSGQRSPKRKDNPVVRASTPKRLNGAPEKGVAQVLANASGALKASGANFGLPLRASSADPMRNGLYYDDEGVPHWKGPAPKKGEAGYDDYLRYRQFLSAKARDKKAALQRIEKESHVRLQGTVEVLDEQLEVLVLKLQRCLSQQDGESPLREILNAAESMKQQVRQSLDWRQEQEAQLMDHIEKGQGSADDAGDFDKARELDELDIKSWS